DETSPEDLCRQLMVSVKRDFSRCVELDRRLVPEVGVAVRGVADPTALSWKVAANVQAGVEVRQRILEECSVLERLRQLRTLLAERLQVLQGQGQSRRRTARDLDSEAMGDDLISGGRAHSRGESLMHLGDFSDELDEIAQAIEAAGMPKTAEEKAFRELERLGKMALMSPEATVCRSYLETLTQIPWRQRTRDRTDLAKVEKILDEDHFGLRKVKERIIELIAVIKLSREVRGPILCLTGPPGVGKTSLGQSIARAIGRRFVRMSLGGMRDESEIRGHRRTYIGSMPGRIIQAMRRAGSINPVILLDEVDKLGSDHRGDPAAALLEVLDPEQNCAFNDHYLQVDYDLSKVLFITTANLLDNIPAPLRDRMEVIRIPGYLENEKIQIARRFLLPRQRKSNGLVEEDLDLPEATLAHMVRAYTREAGVRNLEREIARICRRVAKVKAGGKDRALGKALGQRLGRKPLGITITPEKLKDLLGPTRHEDLTFERSSRVGVATGLAWTSAGGE
ncbi:MAG: AAA family ATPase, partial [Candidatus Eisenbacteria sp.]|nr:AAA family ATPase [Candidatus Eisenbacteria bacterium]